jgi:hypothetical protein
MQDENKVTDSSGESQDTTAEHRFEFNQATGELTPKFGYRASTVLLHEISYFTAESGFLRVS